MSLSIDSVVQRSTDQVSSNVEGEVAIMSIDKGNYYMLNEVGARFWQLIEKPRRIGDACTLLLEEFDTSQGQCETEVIRLGQELLEQNLIEVVDAAST
jgi:hypothetical protein